VELIKQIAGIHLFKDLPDAHLDELAVILADQVFKKGQLIFSEGDAATGFYVVIAGRVKIFKLSVEGKEQILHIFGPGAPIGEVAVFEGKRFPAHAESLEDSRLFFFPRNAFLRLIDDNPSIALHMLAVLSRRLRHFAALIDDLSLKEVPARLAAYLLYLSETQKRADNLSLDISKGQLSSLLGTIPVTLSRILTKMSDAGLIRSIGVRGIQILDRQGLRDLADGEIRLH
jgi:CRP-like cAMP-binding protein